MIAYIETNFLIDFGLRQEDFSATGAIVQLAEESKVVLAVPQISLLEAIHTVEGWRKKRQSLGTELQNEHSRLRRSAPAEPRLETWERTVGELAKLSGEQLNAIQQAMKQVLSRSR
ncbi:MAG: hypothetical protein EXQ47_03245 [Bryobacterales bacterium]|nr:hypothetical protein [Bryobacterales bacterium]